MNSDLKIVIPGGAGLVGQNVIIHLVERGYSNITVIDKHHENILILKQIQPGIRVIDADLADKGQWEAEFGQADIVIMLQSQIGGNDKNAFIRNNLQSTQNILNVISSYQIKPYLIHVSSSVVESLANDDYTQTKTEQEMMVLECQVKHTVLRPTLMFGWFDRKHLGWLARFMKTVPVFPIPGNGQYMRQPLYVKDFANIIISCMEQIPKQTIYNISGLEHVNYIDIIRLIKSSVSAHTLLLHIPVCLFSFLLKVWSIFDKNPPFTDSQLKALITKEEFEIIDWPHVFNVTPTAFPRAIEETFQHPDYSQIKLNF
jgi:nucleoside-diphosphate-sugar epimerase